MLRSWQGRGVRSDRSRAVLAGAGFLVGGADGQARHQEDLTGGQEAEGGLGVKPVPKGVADFEGGHGRLAVDQGVLDLVDHGAGGGFVQELCECVCVCVGFLSECVCVCLYWDGK